MESRMSRKFAMIAATIVAIIVTFVAGKIDVRAEKATIADVKGTVSVGTTEEELWLYNTSDGTYKIKIDDNTDFTGCRFLVTGKAVTVSIYRGDDACLHASKVSGTGSNKVQSATTTTTTSSNQTSMPANTIAVTGTPTDKSSSSVLYLSTKDGTYYLALDGNSDTSGGFLFTPGNTLTCYIYNGGDGNMHLAKSVGTRNTEGSVGSSTTTFSGTIASDSTEKMILLSTSGGTMKFKVDNNTSLNGSKSLVKGQVVTISGSVGTDEYWHAVSISAK